ncbi:Fur family transcriptional regulator [Oscillatoria sp. CS-180]|uniref:Fur family transcriptional regulator n=1 Tax=Oscillatoria sp. CS-180 TaxID=3021720 RepID=UPI00232F0163|nr:Fur family transcriptional regulator [Oscillatoria sp. CS-180]MDB9526566.1 Fur family transcriptional regulator [Oscillatoria sp. CS-180]
MSSKSEVFKVLLNQEGFRLTNQRKKILEVIKEAPDGQHLSAEDIYQKLSGNGEKIGVSTVYRALHLLVDLGVLRELTLAEERKFYELCNPLASTHHHLVCTQCGKVQEFEDASVLNLGTDEAISRGFSPLDCQFIVYGICSDCVYP